jgi:aryl-alcohol dehydrogenase-like predicted oxidoreductase
MPAMPLPAVDRAHALALLQARVDVGRESGDGLLAVQEELGLGVIEVAELLWEAFVTADVPAHPGSIVQRLLDSDSPGSFAYAVPYPYQPDRTAPVLEEAVGTVRIGAHDVPRLALGCMRLVSKDAVVEGELHNSLGIPHSPEAVRHALLTAVDVCGVRYLDVGRGYGPWPGAGEGLLRDWFAPRGGPVDERVLIASKVGYAREPSGGWLVDLDPDFLDDEVHASAAQWGGPVPLLYLVASGTKTTPIVRRPDDIARCYEPLVLGQAKGRATSIGVANVTLAELDRLLAVGPVSVVQNHFSLAAFADPAERAVWQRCKDAGIPFVAWGLFGRGSPRPLPAAASSAAASAAMSEADFVIALLLSSAPNVVVLPGPSTRATIYAGIAAANLRIEPALVAGVLDELARS